jgi:hypothetical protein
MNGSRNIVRRRVLASIAMLCSAIFTILLVPAYAQQDVNPDWYDPAPNPAVVHAAQPPAVAHSSQLPIARFQPTSKSVSPAPSAAKLRVKDATLNQSGHNPARKSGEAPSVELASIASSHPR